MCAFSFTTPRLRKLFRSRLRICRGMDRAVARGGSFHSAARRFRRNKRGRGVKTLLRIYHLWRASGRQAESLVTHYGTGHRRFTLRPGQRRMVALHLRECCSWGELYRALYRTAKRPPSRYIFVRAFTGPERTYLRGLFAARRRARATERQFNFWLREPSRSFFAGGAQ